MSSSTNLPRTPDEPARPDGAGTGTGAAGRDTSYGGAGSADRVTGERGASGTGADRGTTADRTGAVQQPTGRELERQQKDRFGGMKFGACFFGWLTATGTAVLLTGLLTAVGLGVGTQQDLTAAQASGSAGTLGVVSAIVLLVVILVAYYCGGYVAGRMARFNGVKQGVGVWLWTIIAAVVVTVLGLIAGDRFNVLSRLNSLPAVPVSSDALTTGAIISVVVIIVAALVGAVLGGLAGMRYHRRIDRATFTD
ncbi:hypothetical protein GCM10022197_03060 [Microlunatus spumicola]|uniref:Major facilitator superfamily (MFS) profile domain-containing protein n=1 Tax=Microlunatus spumicola TaxID=81499 RepID=A0ABP6WGS5_9ACTN